MSSTVMFAHPDNHHDILRDITLTIAERLQLATTQIHTLVLVLSDLLPQPSTDHARSLGRTLLEK